MPTPEARERRDTEATQQRERVDHLFTLYRFVAIGLAVGALVGLGGGALAFVRMGQVVDDVKDAQTAVQAERYRNVLLNCAQSNERHDSTVRVLDSRLAVAQQAAKPAQIKQLRESRAFTVALIDALAPRRPNCGAYARAQVSAK